MDRQLSAIDLYPVGSGVVRACSGVPWIKEAASLRFFALLIRTVVVYYTQVLQVRIEGTKLRKGMAKKEMKKMCHLE